MLREVSVPRQGAVKKFWGRGWEKWPGIKALVLYQVRESKGDQEGYPNVWTWIFFRRFLLGVLWEVQEMKGLDRPEQKVFHHSYRIDNGLT